MAGIYRPRHPERTVLYRVLFHHFERFVAEYEERFEFLGERESVVFQPAREDVPFPSVLRPPLFAYFAGIDIADRQGVSSRRGQTGRFIGRSRNSWCTGKSKFLSLNVFKAIEVRCRFIFAS